MLFKKLTQDRNSKAVQKVNDGDERKLRRSDTLDTLDAALSFSDRSTPDVVDDVESDDGGSVAFTDKPDVYGQLHPVETPQLIAGKIVAFDAAVNNLPRKRRAALSQAVEECPELLTEKFKLQFLRCDCFNVQLAAKRYGKYWERRLEVFGPDKAFLPLTPEGALKDDAVALSVGLLTLTGTKDSSGRNIMVADPTKQQFDKYSTQSMIRTVWYMVHLALEDEETQKQGLVYIVDLSKASLSLLDKELVRVAALSVTGCIPVRLSGIHGLYPPAVFWVIYPVVKVLLGERLRKRAKFHSGSKKKVLAELAKYGLDSTKLPKLIGGELEV
ncbi:tocopherol transfer protein [Seminavis robusta]|uniref:Tocopherol transfer protein n=1 Tax=Seminavis robusta TaxID=568900 RepID=A0A9N8E0T2_9STRA|nr:tocopherol transfer protein [Seminavis robusta]|eukprot:Sro536_g162190.1 tocopherol transfer protein (329) ;mRNA; f:39247-40233